MISFKHVTLCGIVIALSSLMLLVAGCESSSQNGLAITPESIAVNAASVTNVTFTATGGTPPYTWSVSDSSLGAIIGADDTSAVYTAYAQTGLNLVVVYDAASNSVSAHVTQGYESAGQGLTITPDYIVVTASVTNIITFIASGGTPPYRWSVGNPTNGVLNGIGNGAVYTTYALTGENFVVVSDFYSSSASATILQE